MNWGTLAPVQAILTTPFRCSVPPPPPNPHVMLPQVHGAAGRNKRSAPNRGMSRSVAPPPPFLPSHHPPPSQNQPYSVPPPLTAKGGCGGTHPSHPPRPPPHLSCPTTRTGGSLKPLASSLTVQVLKRGPDPPSALHWWCLTMPFPHPSPIGARGAEPPS